MSIDEARTGEAGAGGSLASRAWARPALVAAALALAMFALYFAVYPVRHIGLPLGFDPAYYVWRSRYLASQGLGSGSTAARPGYPILSALMGSLTGLSQLRLTTVLSLVLVPLMALAVGAFARATVIGGRLGWALTISAAGVVLGPTHLVGENLANALNIALEVGALVLLVAAAQGERHPGWALGSAILALVAAGLTHWVFLPLALAVLGVVFVMVLRTSLRRWAAGEAGWRTDAGLVLILAGTTVVAMVLLIAVVLRAPFTTIEIAPDEVLFVRKFRTDVARLVVPGILGVIGVAWMPHLRTLAGKPGPAGRRAALGLRLLTSWTWVMAAGIVFGAATTLLPPARFLAHLVALPGAVTVGVILTVGVAAVATGRRRRDEAAGASLAIVALALLAIPALMRWYDYPLLMNGQTLAEARTASSYVEALPPGQPVVFLIDWRGGRPGVYGPILIQRTIQIAMPPDRALDVHVFPGRLADLVAGRLTPAPDTRAARETQRLLDDVAPVLGSGPPILVLRSTGESQFADALADGGRQLAPGVVLARGPVPKAVVAMGEESERPPSIWWGLGWAALILAAMAAVGVGWSRAALGNDVPVEVLVALVPVVGAATLVLAGLVAARVGVHLEGAGGLAVVAFSAVAGWLVAVARKRARTG